MTIKFCKECDEKMRRDDFNGMYYCDNKKCKKAGDYVSDNYND